MTSFQTELAVGVHPMDLRGPEAQPIPQDHAQPVEQKSERPFDTKNGAAFGVYERAASEWNVQTFIVSGSVQIAPRQRGRKQATLYVASSAANGVQFASKREIVDAGAGGVLAVGASIDIYSEAPIWVAPISGQASGDVTVVTFFNPSIDV